MKRSTQAELQDEDTSRGEFVYTRLRAGILAGQFRPGQRLREEQLASWLGVSRTPVREALGRLTSEGLVSLAPARGLIVRQLDKQQINELYALREVLEGAAARFAAQHASESEIASMWDLVEAGKKLNDSPDALARLNREFHARIYEASHNRYLLQALQALNTSLALFPSTTLSLPGRALVAEKEHAQIVAAIERRDGDHAESVTKKHIQEAHRLRLRMLASTPTS